MFERFPARHAGIAFVPAARIERHPAHRRLDAVEPAKRRRECGSIRRHRCRSRTARRRPRPTAPEPALDPPEVMSRFQGLRVARENRIVADAAVAEFRHIGLADDDGAGRLEPLDHDVVLVRHEVAIERRPHDRQDILGGDEVLDADRHAGQRAGVFAGRDLGVDGGGRRARHIGRRRAEGVDVRFERLHAATEPLP